MYNKVLHFLFFSPCVLSIEKNKVQDKHQGSNVLKRNCPTPNKYQNLFKNIFNTQTMHGLTKKEVVLR